VGQQPLESAALHFDARDLGGKPHPFQLPRTDYTVLNIDQISKGLGNESCGPSVLDEFTLHTSGTYDYAYTIVPYDRTSTDLMELSKMFRDADSFDRASFDMEEASRVEALINVFSILVNANQRGDIEAARKAYGQLTANQRSLVKNYEQLVKAEGQINKLGNGTIFVTDYGPHGLNAVISDTARITQDTSSPTGYSMSGHFLVPNTTLINGYLHGREPFTMEVWVSPDSLDDFNVFIAKGDTQVSLQTKEGGIEFFIYDGDWHAFAAKDPGWAAHEWHHVVATYDGNRMTTYLDGRAIGDFATSADIRTTGFNLGIGIDAERGRTLSGSIGAAWMYTRALTASEISSRFQADRDGQATTEAPGPDDDNVLFWYDMSGGYAEG
jgi:hypothetical protein